MKEPVLQLMVPRVRPNRLHLYRLRADHRRTDHRRTETLARIIAGGCSFLSRSPPAGMRPADSRFLTA